MITKLIMLLLLFCGLVHADNSNLKPIVVGGPALAFTLPSINEEQAVELVRQRDLTLGELVGVQPAHPVEAVVLYFFDRPNGGEGLRPLNTIQKKFKNQGLAIIAISTDSDPMVVEWVNTLKLDYPVLRDNHQIVSSRYGVRITPMVVLIDKNGLIFSAGSSSMVELEATIEAQVEALFEETSSQ